MADITREAGVANGTFYLYFPSKLELFLELVRTRGHEMRAGLRAATDGFESWADKERAGARAFLDWVRRHPHMYRVVRTAESVDPGVYREWYDKLYDGYVGGLERAMDAGEIPRTHAEALAYAIGAVYDWAGLRWVLWGDGEAIPEDVMDTILTFVLRGMGIHDGPGTP